MKLPQVCSSFSASLKYLHVRCDGSWIRLRLAVQRDGVGSVFEIALRVQIGNEPRLNRPPSQLFLRQDAGSRSVDTKKHSDPAKMIACFLERLADDRYVQVSPDDLSDLASRYALIGHAVISGCSRALLKRQQVK